MQEGKDNQMSRYQFLKSIGFTGGALMALISCVNESDGFVEALTRNPDGTLINPDGTPVEDSTLATEPDESYKISTEELEQISPLYRVDLNNPVYAKLLIPNNFVVLGNTFVLALSRDGVYLAATVVCSHELNRTISYKNNEWYCPVHGARYNLEGTGLNENGKNGIQIYKTAWDGETVIIYE